MEGLYVKWEEAGKVLGRYKYIRNSFRQAVEKEGTHWMDRPIEPNRLRKDVDLFAVPSKRGLNQTHPSLCFRSHRSLGQPHPNTASFDYIVG
jgi:hypothetical protein